MRSILVIGNCAVDVIASPVDSWPAIGGTLTFDHMEATAGGCAANVALALGRLGAGCDLVTRVGEDPFGSFLIDELESAEVGLGQVVIDDAAPTPFSFVAVDSDGRRSFFHCRGTNDRIRRGDVRPGALEGRALVMLSGAMALGTLDGAQAAEVLAAAREQGARTVLDTVYLDGLGRDAWLDRVGPAIGQTDVFAPSLAEARAITGLDDVAAIARGLIDLGARSAVVKLGEEGAAVLDEEGRFTRVAAVPADRVVDETGAGDSFCAGLLAGLAAGDHLVDAARLGAAVASFCVERRGGWSGVPPVDVARERMARSSA